MHAVAPHCKPTLVSLHLATSDVFPGTMWISDNYTHTKLLLLSLQMVQFQLEDQLPDWLRDAKSEEKVLNSKDEQSNDQCHVYHILEEL